MNIEKKIKNTVIKVVREDLTLMEVDAIVFYAQHNLNLGSGVGNAISQRGGPKIQEELKKYGTIKTSDAVTTGAGELKAKHIIHAVGPRFQESDTEGKLHATMLNVFKQAQAHNVEKLALPPMGSGFYGVPLPLSAKVMLKVIKDQVAQGSPVKEIDICINDTREIKPFQTALESL